MSHSTIATMATIPCFEITLLEPLAISLLKQKAGIHIRNNTRFVHPCSSIQWYETSPEQSQRLGLPSRSRLFEVKDPFVRVALPRKNQPSVQLAYPWMLWNGHNRFRMCMSPHYPNLIFEFMLHTENARNKILQGDPPLYTMNAHEASVQEEWSYTGEPFPCRMICPNNPSWRLLIMIQRTVRKADGEPLRFYADRSFAIRSLVVIESHWTDSLSYPISHPHLPLLTHRVSVPVQANRSKDTKHGRGHGHAHDQIKTSQNR